MKINVLSLFITLVFEVLISDGFSLNVNIAQGKCDVSRCINYADPEKAFDGDISTHSSGKEPFVVGVLALDFGSKKPLLKTTMNRGTQTVPYYKIQGSDDGTSWTDILRVWDPLFPIDERSLPAVSFRYVRFVIPYLCENDCPDYPTPMDEIAVYERGAGDPQGEPAIKYAEPLDRTGWTATVGTLDFPQAINKQDQGFLDPHGGIAYQIGGKNECFKSEMNKGLNIVLDMKTAQTFNQLHVVRAMDAFYAYSIYASDDGQTWGLPILSGTNVNGLMEFNFPTQHKRYIKYENDLFVPGRWWGFMNVSVYNTAGTTAIDTGDDINIAKNAIASMGTNSILVPKTVDGDLNTGVACDNQISLDLKSVYSIARVHLRINNYGQMFFANLLTSDDGKNWTKRQRFEVGSPAINTLLDVLIRGGYKTRYIQIQAPGLNQGGNWAGPQFYEIEAYASKGEGLTTTMVRKQGMLSNSSSHMIKTQFGISLHNLNGRKINASIHK